MTGQNAAVIVSGADEKKISAAFEIAWGSVFSITNKFIDQHDKFGFRLIAAKSCPRIEDMALVLKLLGALLDAIESKLPCDATSELRMLLNAKQQIILFERAVLAVQSGNEQEYDATVAAMRAQAQF